MTIYNRQIREALTGEQDFEAHVLILRQDGADRSKAKFQAWSAGPVKGREAILDWMKHSATTPSELLRPDLEAEQ